MKKILLSLILITSLLAPVQRSHAVVGLFTSGSLVALAGLTYLAGNVVFWTTGETRLGEIEVGGVLVQPVLGVLIAIAGVIMLDGESGAKLEFGPLTSLKGHSEKEIAIYNSELDELNAINSMISEDVTTELEARARWEEMREKLSPETVRVAGSIGTAALKALR